MDVAISLKNLLFFEVIIITEDGKEEDDVYGHARSSIDYSSNWAGPGLRKSPQIRPKVDNWEQGFEQWEVIGRNVKPEKETGETVSKQQSGRRESTNSLNVKEAQEQLKKVVETKKIKSLGAKPQKKWVCPVHKKADCSFLMLNSNASNTNHWLEVKGFSETARAILESMNGEMLFSLSKEQLEKYLGEEGSRLYSHLTVQRSICGVKTARSKELKSILEQRRRLTDEALALKERRIAAGEIWGKTGSLADEFSQINDNNSGKSAENKL